MTTLPAVVARARVRAKRLDVAIIHRAAGRARRRPGRRSRRRHRRGPCALGVRDGCRPAAPAGHDRSPAGTGRGRPERSRRRLALSRGRFDRGSERRATAGLVPARRARPAGVPVSAFATSRDPLTGFFLVRRDSLDLAALRPNGFKILLEILVRSPRLAVSEIVLPVRDPPGRREQGLGAGGPRATSRSSGAFASAPSVPASAASASSA